ncbi:hypothetical protein P148_SR1C00001G0285 [candidate division SR1 bacterium RAAC1_SR1_1]|nr:hypothetical protein P148_SR1C00001G0285 [candidate division SR1 bacterium RAAC1_SR1_1]
MDKKNILILAIIVINIPFFIGVMMLIEKAFDKSRESQNNSIKIETGSNHTGLFSSFSGEILP